MKHHISIFYLITGCLFFCSCSQSDRQTETQKRLQQLEKAISRFEDRLAEQSNDIRQLRTLLDASSTSTKDRPAVQRTGDDPAERLKNLLSIFVSVYTASPGKLPGEWSVSSYDIRKTDSVVSPLLAVVRFNQEMGKRKIDINARYNAVFVLQDGGWVLKSLTSTAYTSERDVMSEEIRLNDRTEPIYPFATFLQSHIR